MVSFDVMVRHEKAALTLAMLLPLLAHAQSSPTPACITRASSLCTATPECKAFGIYENKIQLHGCAVTVPNNDWAIFVQSPNGSYTRLPGHVNVDESKCQHHVGEQASCLGPSPPPPPMYNVQGVVDIGTLENSIFSWEGRMYLLENIACGYSGHAGKWFPEFANHSYARVRDLLTGRVVANVTSTISHAFVSAYPDFESKRLWLFGVNEDRCHGTHKGTLVQAWWTSDLVTWQTTVAIPNTPTYNVEVSRVHAVPAGLPQHTHVMILEPFTFMAINAVDGNLTGSQWFKLDSKDPPAPSGGPSIRFSDGYYYILTGGRTVELLRTTNFQSWESAVHNPFIKPTPADATESPFCDFPATADSKGFAPMRKHPELWDWNSNDGDVCCMDPSVNGSWIVWGASTQGHRPLPPVKDGAANVVGNASMPLPKMLAMYFEQ